MNASGILLAPGATMLAVGHFLGRGTGSLSPPSFRVPFLKKMGQSFCKNKCQLSGNFVKALEMNERITEVPFQRNAKLCLTDPSVIILIYRGASAIRCLCAIL